MSFKNVLRNTTSARLLLFVGILSLSFAQQTLHAAAIDEDEIVSRGLVFSPPDDLSSRQRSIAALNGFSLLGGAHLFGTTEDNIYRSPDPLAQSSAAFGEWFYLRGDTRIGTKTRMLTTFNWTQDAHAISRVVDVRKFTMSNWVSVEFNKQLKFSADIDVVSENDNAVIITGVPYDRDYGYLKSSGEIAITWQPVRTHQFSFIGDIQRKNYNETFQLNSLDWDQTTFGLRYKFRISNKSNLRLRYSNGVRAYDSELSSLQNGSEVSSNPMERHRYVEGRASLDFDPSKNTSLTLEYSRRSRTDLFQGFETWKNENWKGSLETKLNSRFELGAQLSYLHQHFDTMTGDNNEKLAYTRLSAGVGSRFTITSSIRIFAAADYYTRDSNKSTGTLYLDYEGTTISVGMSFFLFPGKLSKKSA